MAPPVLKKRTIGFAPVREEKPSVRKARL